METKQKENIISACKNELNKTITEIASQFKVSRRTVHVILKNENIHRHLLKFDHNFFESIDTQGKAYWLGFIFADGCICDKRTVGSKSLIINLATKDDSHLNKFQQQIKSKLNLHYKTTEDAVYVKYYSDKMCEDLIKLGCTPRKSLTLKFPDIKENLHQHFIRGYIDGDGCISLRSYRGGKRENLQVTIVGTESLLNTLQFLFFKNLNMKYKKLQDKGKAKGITIGGNKQCRKLVNWLYKDANVYLDRKYAKTL